MDISSVTPLLAVLGGWCLSLRGGPDTFLIVSGESL